MHHEDIILIERLRKGDTQAFEQLFKPYYERVCLFANRFIDNMPAAEEIVADTYAALWEKRTTILISISFRAYIYRAVQNRCLNHIKHQRIEREYIEYVLQNYLPVDDHSDSTREEELEREVEDAIENLPDRCRQIFKMSRYDHLRYREIARKLELSPKTVERQMVIALEKLRRHLKHLFASV
jgi:RNA polymerase sigma-70 factor (ECF subfamily)